MRFIIKNDNMSALQCLTLDEALFKLKGEGKISDTIFLWRPARFIYLILNASINYIDRQYAESNGYPVTRSAMLPGKPTSAVIVGDTWNLITAIDNVTKQEKINHFIKFGPAVWMYVLGKLGIETDLRLEGADIVVKGTDKKLVGFGLASTENGGLYTNSYVADKLPSGVDLDKVFLLPIEKFEGKSVSSVSDRITSVETLTSKVLDQNWLVDTIKDYFGSIGVALEQVSDFTKEEYDLAKTLEAKHSSEEWIKYADIPE